MKPPQEEARQVRLREMRWADMPRIMALEQKLFPEDAWTPEMFAAEFAQPASRRLYLVAEEGDTVIGYAGMMFTGGPQADVVTLGVEPSRWSRGSGTALLTPEPLYLRRPDAREPGPPKRVTPDRPGGTTLLSWPPVAAGPDPPAGR